MNKYNSFLTLFILSVVASFAFMIIYFKGIFAFVFHAQEHTITNPFEIFSTLFSPALILSLIITVITGLACRILGIVYVARNKTVADGEKALWIIGFIFMSFVTSIVFLIMGKNRKYME